MTGNPEVIHDDGLSPIPKVPCHVFQIAIRRITPGMSRSRQVDEERVACANVAQLRLAQAESRKKYLGVCMTIVAGAGQSPASCSWKQPWVSPAPRSEFSRHTS